MILEIIPVWPERPGHRSQESVNRCHHLISVWGRTQSLPLSLALRDTVKSTVVNTYVLMDGYMMRSTGAIRTWGAAAVVEKGELFIK